MASGQKQAVRLIGLAGGVASGKTTVARIFRKLGAAVIDADRIARRCLGQAEVRRKISERFGRYAVRASGAVDRQKLAGIVFRNRSALEKLSRIVHPYVLREIRRNLSARPPERSFGRVHRGRTETRGVRWIVLDAPLLRESRLADRCDLVIYVRTRKALRFSRARAGRGWQPVELRRREQMQLPLWQKAQGADFIIDNSGNLPWTERQVRKIFSSLRKDQARATPLKSQIQKPKTL